MGRALLAAAVLATGGAAAAGEPQEIEPFDVAGVEIRGPDRAVWVGETFTLELLLTVDMAFFEQSAVPLLRRPLGLQVAVAADWLEGIDGSLVALEPSGEAPPGPTVAVGDRVVATTATSAPGAARTELRIALAFRATAPATLRLDGPVLRFAYATEFGEGFLGAREPRDRREAFVVGSAFDLELRALPEAGRPPDFDAAVGSLAATARARPGDLALGETLELVLTLAGTAADAVRRAPTYPSSDELRSQGWRVGDDVDGVQFVYSLEPLRDGALEVRVPGVPYFDPELGRYRAASVPPIPIIVRGSDPPRDVAAAEPPVAPGPTESPGPDRPEPGQLESEDGVAADDGSSGRLPRSVAVFAGVLGAMLLLEHRRRRRRRAAAEADRPTARARLRVATRDLEARLAVEGADAGRLLMEALAEALECSAAAVVDRDLAQRLEAAGFAATDASAAASLVEQLVAERFGGEGRAEPARDVLEVVRRLCERGGA